MTDAAEKLRLQLSQLPQEDRAALAHYLIHSLDEGEDEGWEAAWDAELAKRLEDIDSGREVGEPAESVLKRLREKYS
jgi:putative addiction module component (TIGR02574 family)